MKDLEFFENYFSALRIILTVVLATIVCVSIVGLCKGFGECFTPLIISIILWCVFMVAIKLNEILYTRFIAATENIYEMTTMLESYYNEKVKKERKEKEIVKTEKEILDLEQKLANAKEKFNELKQ